MKFTVFGGTGFIGTCLVNYLREQGHEVYNPNRDELINIGKPLGHVIYAIGLTGNFRTRPYDTIEAHVCLLARLLKLSQFDSWLYLSSTRIYSGLPIDTVANEQVAISVTPQADNLYDLSKMLGESLCLTHPSCNVRVARLSNVYGFGQSKHTFLASVMQDVQESNQVVINESPDSCKDYVAVEDVLPLLQAIATHGKKRIYNVASGRLITHAELAEKLTCLTNSNVTFSSGAIKRVFPLIDINEIVTEFQFSPSMLLDELGGLLSNFKIQFHHGDSL